MPDPGLGDLKCLPQEASDNGGYDWSWAFNDVPHQTRRAVRDYDGVLTTALSLMTTRRSDLCGPDT